MSLKSTVVLALVLGGCAPRLVIPDTDEGRACLESCNEQFRLCEFQVRVSCRQNVGGRFEQDLGQCIERVAGCERCTCATARDRCLRPCRVPESETDSDPDEL